MVEGSLQKAYEQGNLSKLRLGNVVDLSDLGLQKIVFEKAR